MSKFHDGVSPFPVFPDGYDFGAKSSADGFTWEDVRQLKRCADNAERYASEKLWDEDDHRAHEHTRTVIKRIEARLLSEVS